MKLYFDPFVVVAVAHLTVTTILAVRLILSKYDCHFKTTLVKRFSVKRLYQYSRIVSISSFSIFICTCSWNLYFANVCNVLYSFSSYWIGVPLILSFTNIGVFSVLPSRARGGAPMGWLCLIGVVGIERKRKQRGKR